MDATVPSRPGDADAADGTPVVGTPVVGTSEAELHARRLPVAGTQNLRDIGGYETRDGRSVAWRRILRSDALHLLDDEGRRCLAEIGVRTSLDLREPGERRDAPDHLGRSVRLVSLPLFTHLPPGYDRFSAPPIDRSALVSIDDAYDQLVRHRGPVLVAALRELLEPGALPAIVHCALGKDRTGVVIALLLAIAGVPDEVIAADYGATRLFLDSESLERVVARGVAAGRDPRRTRALMACDPESMLVLLDGIARRHGSVEGYLEANGLAETELEELRLALLSGAGRVEHGPVELFLVVHRA